MILSIYGYGGLGREILDAAYCINNAKHKWEKIIFIDDFELKQVIDNAEVLTFNEFLLCHSTNNAKVVIAVGEPKVRQELFNIVTEEGYALQTLIHPSAFIGTDTHIGDGTIIQYGSFISCNVSIGSNVLVQPNASIGHDSVIGSSSVISSYTAISGNCTIGDRVYIGVSVPVKEQISIGTDSIIGMGSAVLRDIPDNVVAIGNPARPMKMNDRKQVFS